MRVHYLQHVEFEGLGSLVSRFARAGWLVSCTRLFAGESLPEPERVDLLVVMGGPMSVNDEEAYPWLIKEKSFIKDVIAQNRPVLGICLGAQLIASALGGRVYPNAEKEIGWFPVCRVEPLQLDTFRFPETIEVFHWHGETFDLPGGCVHLARSACCRHQAFQYGRLVIGLQFHLETTPESAQSLVEHCRDELVEGGYVQTEQEILAANPARYVEIHRLMDDILDYLVQNARS